MTTREWFTLLQATVVDTGLYTKREWRIKELKPGVSLWLERRHELSTHGMVSVHANVDGVPSRIGFVGLTHAPIISELLMHGYAVKCELAEGSPIDSLQRINVMIQARNGEL